MPIPRLYKTKVNKKFILYSFNRTTLTNKSGNRFYGNLQKIWILSKI